MRTLVLGGSLSLALSFACSDGDAVPIGTGKELFDAQCAMCHMRDGSGGMLAPTLHGKKQHWTRDALLAYLLDPPGYAAKDARLHAQGAKYSQPMPTYKMLPREALEKLADHVLAMP